MNGRKIAISGTLAFILAAGLAYGAAATAGQAKGTEDPDLNWTSIQMEGPYTQPGSDGSRASIPHVEASGPIKFGGETNTTLAITDGNATVAIDPHDDESLTVEDDSIIVSVYEADGNMSEAPSIDTQRGGRISVDIDGDTDELFGGDELLKEFRVELREDGSLVDATRFQPFMIDYPQGNLDYRVANDEVTMTYSPEVDATDVNPYASFWDVDGGSFIAETSLEPDGDGNLVATVDVNSVTDAERVTVRYYADDGEEPAADSFVLNAATDDLFGLPDDTENQSDGSAPVDTQTDDSIPGFGVGAAVTGLIGSLLVFQRYRI